MSNKLFVNQPCLTKEQVEGYLNNTLTGNALHSVENHLLDCPFCAEAIEGYSGQDILEIFNLEKSMQLKNISPDTTMAPPAISPFLTLNRIAATLLLVFLANAGYQYWNYRSEQQMGNQITADIREMETTYRGETTQRAGAVGQAIQLYETKEYELAIKSLKDLQEQDAENPEIAFYLGMAYLENSEPARALHWLSVARINDPERYEQASWQLVRACQDAGQPDKAIRILEELADMDGSVFQEDAKSLLEKLEK